MWGRAFAVWLLLLVGAVLNGGFREAVLTPRLGTRVAHAVSTILLCALIVVIAWVSRPWLDPRTPRGALWVGAAWCGWTIAFEFLAGHYLFGKPWPTLIADYNLMAGRIWILVPITTVVAPLVAWLGSRK